MNRRVMLIGAVVTVPVVAALAASFGRDPHEIRTPMIGRPAPAFALRDVTTSEELSLAALRGTPVVINFWATWCVPCLQEHAALVSTAASRGSDVQFIGVVYDDTPERVREFLQQHGRAYPSLLDEHGRTAIAYGVYGVPETFFVNRSGVIAAKHTGALTTTLLTRNLEAASQ